MRILVWCGVLACVLACNDGLVRIDARDGSTLGLDAGTPDGFTVDALPTDAMLDAGMDAPDMGTPLHPALYPEGPRHSPMTPFVVENLRAVRARADDLQNDVFSKLGASITVSTNFMHCFAGSDIDLAGRTGLQTTIDHFAAGDAAGTTPYTRESESATVGWHAGRALEGTPPAVEREVEAARPAFATIMYGTNDINIVTREQYANNMLDLTDGLLDRGVIPILSSIPARGDDAGADAEVPVYNLIARAIAQARQTPFVDYHRDLAPLPNRGLGGDNIHPTVFRDPGARGCVFTEAGLQFGYNVRNLVTIEALDRAHRATTLAEAAPDPAGPALVGDGSPDNPFVIPQLPFTHDANTLFSDHRNLNLYDGCGADQNEGGPELLYRLDLDRAMSLLIMVFDRGTVDIDVHLLSGTTEGSCLSRAHRQIEADVGPGTYYLSLDTFVGSTEQAGEYLLAVMER